MAQKSNLIILIDANALIHRAYHAIPPLTSTSGEPTNATFGFTSTLLKALQDFKPACVALAFDVGRTFRHEEYAEYKGQRGKAPDDLAVQLRRCRDIARAFGIPVYAIPGYEADDVLATLAEQATAQRFESVIVTGDTDSFQLIGPQVQVYMVGRKFTEGVLYDVDKIKERYGLEPQQLVDLKGLSGDTSDNIPGVSGVGEKTATKLLQQFGSVEEIYAHLGEIESRWRQKLEAGKEQALQGKHLVQLVRQAPVTLDLEACAVQNYDRQRVTEMFRELGFFTLLPRLPGQPTRTQLSFFGEDQEPSSVPESAEQNDYQIVDTEAALDALVRELRQAGAFALDTETTSLDPLQADLVGISVSAAAGSGYYIPVGHAAEQGANLPLALVKARLGPLLADSRIAKYCHNADFDLMTLAEHDLPVAGLAFDTMIGAFLLDPSRASLGLKQLVWERFGIEMTPISALIGKGEICMAQVPVSQVGPYAAADADLTLRLVEPLRRELEEKQLMRLFQEVELPLIPVLMEMERQGVAIDVPFLQAMSQQLMQQLGQLECKIYDIAGHPFNVNSTKQLGQVLFTELKLRPPKRTATGFSTDASVMEELKGAHPIVDLLTEYRQLSKIKSTYLDALPALVNPHTGRLHTSYNQVGAVTGRISSSNPNLQNIPVRSEVGREVRQAFVAPPGQWLLEADYSQVELRILAHVADDPALKLAFSRDEDIHASTAAAIMGVPLEQVTAEQRRVAKTTNFGIVYGIGSFTLAQRTGLSPEDATRFINNYFDKYSRVRDYLEQTKEKARRDGWVETLLGRRRYFPELLEGSRANLNLKRSAERMAINMPIQGLAADIIKLAMIEVDRVFRAEGWQSKMILQVHDELVFEIPEEELGVVRERVRQIMESIYPLAVPLRVDIKIGRNWGEMG